MQCPKIKYNSEEEKVEKEMANDFSEDTQKNITPTQEIMKLADLINKEELTIPPYQEIKQKLINELNNYNENTIGKK